MSARYNISRFIAPLMALLLMMPVIARADSHAPTDTIRPDTIPVTPRPIAGWAGIGAGAAMLGGAALMRQAYPRNYHVGPVNSRSDRGTDYLQYAPLAAPWILKAAGVPTRSGWGRMAVSQGAAIAIMAGSVKAMKESIHSVRPDGFDDKSFPSGHTAWAFMGATMMARELGEVSPWYAVGAYAFATGVAVERAVDRHHYPTDVGPEPE